MTWLKTAGAALLLLAALESPAIGQEAALAKGSAGAERASASAAESDESPLRAQARQIITSVADDAPKWDDGRAAVRVLSKAADLLWDEDPARARSWLTRAWEMSGKVRDDGDVRSAVRVRGTAHARARSEVLAVAQGHDAKFARQLVDTLSDEAEEADDGARRGPFDDRTARSEQLLNLAAATVESNPAAAEQIAERSLADGISFQLQDVLLRLRAHDPNLANRLFDSALRTLATTFSQPSEGQILASYLFTPGRVMAVDAQSRVNVNVNPLAPALAMTPAQADPARARRFLTVMQQRLLAMPPPSTTANPSAYAQDFITLVRSLSGAYGKYAPDLWVPLAQRMTQFVPDAAAVRRSPAPDAASARASAAPGLSEAERHQRYMDDLEEAADAETDPVARKLAYLKAALNTDASELERGRRIASKIEEKELRDQVVSFLSYRAALGALEKKRAEEAVNLVSGARPIQKAIIFISAAQAIAAERPKGETEWQAGARSLRVLELLAEADKLLKGEAEGSVEALRVRLGLVAALAKADSVRAYGSMGEVVNLVNGMKSFDFMETTVPRVPELGEPTAELLLPQIGGGYGITDAFRALASADFPGSVQMANRLNAPEGRGVVLLEIGSSVLKSKETKAAPAKTAAPPTAQ
ncbi:MAG TPA: hypothetical protein VGP08_05895 [Pyrinomonadaceae bacterium]|jgi:hypothetical protein|nr:hypothetical protein [Pyrinomonadaceae bacterium]